MTGGSSPGTIRRIEAAISWYAGDLMSETGDGSVTALSCGTTVIWVEHYELQGSVTGKLSRGERTTSLELQVTVDGTTSAYSGEVEGDTARGRVYVGGVSEGRFTLRHE